MGMRMRTVPETLSSFGMSLLTTLTEATQPYGDVAFVRINKEFLFHKNYNYNKILQICLQLACLLD